MTPTTYPTPSLVSRLGGATRRTLARLRPGTAGERTPRTRAGSAPRRLPPRRRGSRGVSEVIGFILIFGVIILGMTLVQLYGVPATNERLEFEHSQRALGDVAELSDLFSQAIATGQQGAVTIEAGMNYPSRLFLFNPAPVSGSIRLDNAGQVTISNALGTGDVADYWNGSPQSFDTAGVAYRAEYNLYEGAPTRLVENGLVYDRFPNGEFLPRNRAPLIDGRSITLVTITGDVSTTSSGSIVFEAAPVSVASAPITVRNVSAGQNVTLTVPTGLSAPEMEEVLATELHPNGNVLSVSDGSGNLVIIELAAGSYDLRTTQLQVGTSEAPDVDAHYVVSVTDAPFAVGEGSSRVVVVEVRDSFNNPVSGVTVEATTVPGIGSIAPLNDTTDQDGRVRLVYSAPADISGTTQRADQVRFTIGERDRLGTSFDRTELEETALNVTIENLDLSGVTSPNGSAGDPGAGYGGISYWNTTDTNQTFAVPNGKWLSISKIDAIELSNGEMVTRQVCQDDGGGASSPFAECRIVDELHLGFTVWNGDAYAVDIHLRDANRNGTFRDLDPPHGSQKVDWSDIQRVVVTDTDGTIVFNGELSDDAINRTLKDRPGSGMDILDATNYVSVSTGGQPVLDNLKMFDATWFTGTMHGRVLVTIPASTP